MSIWIKYRTSWSHGYGDWYYHHIDYLEDNDKEGLEAAIEELAHNDNSSDHYRGIQWLKVKAPSKEFLEKAIWLAEMSLKSHQEKLLFLKDTLKKVKSKKRL